MDSRAPVPVLSPETSRIDINLIRFSFKNFKLCPQLQHQLYDTAIKRIAGDMQKAMHIIRPIEFIEARDRIEIPHGMFGLSLEKFYERRHENGVYLKLLKMVSKKTLEHARVCTVLDELLAYLSRLFFGYRCKDMKLVVSDITDSMKLLTIMDTIRADYKINLETFRTLQEQLQVFNEHEREQLEIIDNQLYNAQQSVAEEKLILNPIKYRYVTSYDERSRDQMMLLMHNSEEDMRNSMNRIKWKHEKENDVTLYVRMKWRTEVDAYKSSLKILGAEYDHKYDYLDSQIIYKTNVMSAMREQQRDCQEKMKYFAKEMGHLRKWRQLSNWRMREELQRSTIIVQPVKKKKLQTKPRKKKITFAN